MGREGGLGHRSFLALIRPGLGHKSPMLRRALVLATPARLAQYSVQYACAFRILPARHADALPGSQNKNFVLPEGLGHRSFLARKACGPASRRRAPAFESLREHASALEDRHLVLPEGLEPPTTVPKTVVISISPREQWPNHSPFLPKHKEK